MTEKLKKNQIESLKKNPQIEYVSKTTIKIKKEVLKKTEGCKSIGELKKKLKENDIPVEIIGEKRIANLFLRYASSNRTKYKIEKKRYNEEEKEELERNEKINRVIGNKIEFEEEFMKEIAQKKTRKEAREKFEEEKINIKIIGEARIDKTYYRWRNKYKKN